MSSPLQDFALQTASTIIGGGFLTVGGLAFVAAQRARRLRCAIDLLLSTWDHYRDPANKYSIQQFAEETALAISEITEELSTTDSAILRPNLKTRQALRRLLDEIKEYSDALIHGEGDKALGVAFIVIVRNADDAQAKSFYHLLSRLAALRDSIGFTTYYAGDDGNSSPV